MSLTKLGKTPISEGNPPGADVRLDPDFEALSGEIEKLSSPSGEGSLDWKKVVSLSQVILTNKSKDILVAFYLSVGLMKMEGFDGLAKGASVLRDLLETFWEGLFPSKQRMKGRKNAIDWWMEKVRSGIVNMRTERWPEDKKEEFIANLKAIDVFLGEHMDDAPVMSPLIANIASMIEVEEIMVEKPAVQGPLSVPEPTSPLGKTFDSPIPPPAADRGRTKGISPEMDMETDRLLRQGLNLLGKAGSIMAQHDPVDHLPFRLNRVVAWISVTSLPPSVDGKTLLPPPDELAVNALRTLYQSANWKDLLPAAEARVAEHVFWIDLSRYSVESLENLDQRHIAELVATETFLYVKRLPGIERLSFSDGTPFASEDTREWLNNIGRGSQAKQDLTLSSGLDELDASIARETSEALELVKANKLPEALNAFRAKLNRAPSARERFVWEIGFLRLLSQTKQTNISGPYLREILKYIDIYKIEQWEPALAIEALTIVLSSMRLRRGEKDEGLAKSIFDRITALSPARALDLANQPG